MAQLAAWRLAVARRVGVWAGLGLLMGVLGGLSLATGRITLSPEVDPLVAGLAGAGSGIGLFAATRVFVRVVRSWAAFQRDTAELYGNRATLTLPVALVVASCLSAPGEEVFWRGLVGGRLATALGSLLAGAAVALAGHVVVSTASASRPVIAAALVGGLVWSALFVWTGGVLAGILSHAIFTGLMLALPPPVARARSFGPAETSPGRRSP